MFLLFELVTVNIVINAVNQKYNDRPSWSNLQILNSILNFFILNHKSVLHCTQKCTRDKGFPVTWTWSVHSMIHTKPKPHTHTHLLQLYGLRTSGSPICDGCWTCFCFLLNSTYCRETINWVSSWVSVTDSSHMQFVTATNFTWPETAALRGRCDKPYVYGALSECCTVLCGLSAEWRSYRLSEIPNKYCNSPEPG